MFRTHRWTLQPLGTHHGSTSRNAGSRRAHNQAHTHLLDTGNNTTRRHHVASLQTGRTQRIPIISPKTGVTLAPKSEYPRCHTESHTKTKRLDRPELSWITRSHMTHPTTPRRHALASPQVSPLTHTTPRPRESPGFPSYAPDATPSRVPRFPLVRTRCMAFTGWLASARRPCSSSR